ncbi:MAG TPA: ScyD/ScyE family protein [Longimicrobiales bacterium]|nr:ScyD/ScyE family protein [Longimicrobiales bacterium]
MTEPPVADQPTLDVRSETGPFTGFSAPVFDVSTTPDGSLVAVSGTSVYEIDGSGMTEVAAVPTAPGSGLNGIAANGRRDLWVTSAGQDLAVGAGVWRVSAGRTTLVGDIEAFETANDPDALAGPGWKNVACEGDPRNGPYTAGPQSNPYHLTSHRGGALVADAAGNSLLRVGADGSVELVAVFTPPTGDGSDWQVNFVIEGTDGEPDIPCYVQPVPTSVAVGSKGRSYVGELTGLTLPQIGGAPAPAWSRVWEIDAGATGVTCPSDACRVAFDGFTSIVDVAIGPEGHVYVLEMDEAGWFAATTGGATHGTLSRCDPGSGVCEVVTEELFLPGALTFDKWGGLWVVNSSLFATEIVKIDAAS